MMTNKLVRGAFLALTALFVATGGAFAHSGLQRAEPQADSKFKRPPTEVKLYFSEQLEPAYSSVQVESEKGEKADRKDSHVDRSNPKLLRASLAPLEPGTYTVIWRVLSVDSHVTQGRFKFHVE